MPRNVKNIAKVREQSKAFDKWHKEFLTLPSKEKPATTTQASIRNAVYNVKQIPKDFMNLGGKIKKVLTDPQPARTRRGAIHRSSLNKIARGVMFK